MKLRESHRLLIGLTLLAILLTFASLTPLLNSTAEQMRLRNSLIAEVGDHSAFDWTPGNSPPAFHMESEAAPDMFIEAAENLTSLQSGTHRLWRAALELSDHLAEGPGIGGRIQSNTAETYKMILSEKAGYCADYRRAFSGLAHAARIPVRQWGMTFDDFGEEGHAFSEIFSPQWNKWIFLDSYYSFYVEDPMTKVPLSVLELSRALRSGAPFERLHVVRITPERFTFDTDESALTYYQIGSRQMFLLMRNDVFTYDRHPVVEAFSPISRKGTQLAAIALGIFPKIQVVPSDENWRAVDSLYAKRNRYFGAMILLVLLGLSLWAEISIYRRRKLN